MIRKAAYAGSFYSRHAGQLTADFEAWTRGKAQAGASERVRGLIVPHAGYMYSGQCAALGYHYLSSQNIDRLIVLHPSHQGINFDWSVSPFTEYETPLGTVTQDAECAELLAQHSSHQAQTRLHEQEHSLEVQLPLIRHFLPEARICPVMIARPYPEVASKLAAKLREIVVALPGNTVFVVSTDLSHYYNADRAEKMDALILKYILGFDPDALWQGVLGRRCEACGIGGLLTLLHLCKDLPGIDAKIIEYTHSGKVTRDNQQVVGYLSAVLYQQQGE